MILLEVRDSGCGIPGQDQARVFEPFFSTKPGGIGLGLAVARRSIESFGGKISFQSRIDAGTVFRLVLPNARRGRARQDRRAARRQWLQPTQVDGT